MVVGGSVDWEVDMGKGASRDHEDTWGDPQPATIHPSLLGAPVRDAVVAGHRGDLRRASSLVGHPDPAVRAGALGALYRMGALGSPVLADALGDPDAAVRRRGCVLAGRSFGAGTVDVSLVEALTATLTADPDAMVVESAAWALGEAGSDCAPATVRSLGNVAGTHRDPLCREAAVAALGAIGDPGALDVVLAALADKSAVRRRATIALVAFDDPRVEVALRRCLDDRDWQVRQAAEDLLVEP